MCKRESNVLHKSEISTQAKLHYLQVSANYFKVLRTCRGSVAMDTIYVVMFDIIVQTCKVTSISDDKSL